MTDIPVQDLEGVPSVVIPLAEYQELLTDQRKLRALENGGVDNWDFYDEAMDEFRDSDD